ncbi:MAG: hypothetical protein V4501_08185 [Pseudomonadota bacterium]
MEIVFSNWNCGNFKCPEAITINTSEIESEAEIELAESILNAISCAMPTTGKANALVTVYDDEGDEAEINYMIESGKFKRD